MTEDDGPSGFGFELTFRLRRAPEDRCPPTWPAELMQSLAKYVFNSGKVSNFIQQEFTFQDFFGFFSSVRAMSLIKLNPH